VLSLIAISAAVLRAEISLSHEDFRREVRGVRGEALQQEHPSPAEPIMNLWFRLCRAVGTIPSIADGIDPARQH
jgi:hypothetical protein